VKRLFVLLLPFAAAVACSSGPQPSASTASPGAPPTPTPSASASRLNPDVVEETDTYTIQRLRKKDYIRVDDRHIRHPLVGRAVEFFREDDDYYYVYVPKVIKEEVEAKQAEAEQNLAPNPVGTPTVPNTVDYHGMPPEDFEDLAPARVTASFRLEPVAASGLPTQGMWRHSFVIADVNGDGIPDIVSPPSRIGGDPTLHVWLGDGHGAFARQKLAYEESGKTNPIFSAAYGGVAVGDIDGDGKLDVVMASHVGGLVSLFGKGNGTYEVVRKGLPGRDFSTQAVVLADVNGDGRLDIIASADTYDYKGKGWDPHQLRVYLYDGARGWKYSPDALQDGAYSNCLTAWDYDRDGRADVLTGSQAYGAVQILWKNTGAGRFTTGYFPEIEIHGFHFATAPGTFGKSRIAAFADAFNRSTNTPMRLQAEGITVYSYENGSWARHRVWRKKDGKSYLFALAMGDLDGDGLDDVVFADSESFRLRIFLQQPDGSVREVEEKQEPRLDSPGQCIRLADLDGDGRLDVVLSKTYATGGTEYPGGWTVYLNRK
jgi:FG-GAP-like repeat